MDRSTRLRRQALTLSTDLYGWRAWLDEVAAWLCEESAATEDVARRAQFLAAVRTFGWRDRDPLLAELALLRHSERESERRWAELAQLARHALTAESLIARGMALHLIDRWEASPMRGP